MSYDEENTVAAGEDMDETMAAAEAPADDAQAAEITAEELMDNLTGGAQGNEPESTGEDGGQADGAAHEDEQKHTQEKTDRRIRAALRQQRETIFRQLGMSEAEVRELIRQSKADKLAKDDPEISPKAARRIVEAEERTEGDVDRAALVSGIRSLMEDGWTSGELLAFSQDETAQQQIAGGKTVRQAANAYLRRQMGAAPSTQSSAARREVPTVRARPTEAARDRNAIADMSDEEFDRFSRRAMSEAMAGKRITIR